MGKRKDGKDLAAAAAADKGKKDKNRRSSGENLGISGPVPVRKVPSLRGKHQLGLYAASSFERNAPSPKKLPQPPMRWMKAAVAEVAPDVGARGERPHLHAAHLLLLVPVDQLQQPAANTLHFHIDPTRKMCSF